MRAVRYQHMKLAIDIIIFAYGNGLAGENTPLFFVWFYAPFFRLIRAYFLLLFLFQAVLCLC